jgi:hypothetical protein
VVDAATPEGENIIQDRPLRRLQSASFAERRKKDSSVDDRPSPEMEFGVADEPPVRSVAADDRPPSEGRLGVADEPPVRSVAVDRRKGKGRAHDWSPPVTESGVAYELPVQSVAVDEREENGAVHSRYSLAPDIKNEVLRDRILGRVADSASSMESTKEHTSLSEFQESETLPLSHVSANANDIEELEEG